MRQYARNRSLAAIATLLGAVGSAVAAGPVAAQQPRQDAPQAKANAKAAPQKPAARQASNQPSAARAEQAIIALVNDEPITAYEVEQRARFMALNENIGDKAKENFQRLAQSESTTKKIRAILEEVVKQNPGKSREEVGAIFEKRKTEFAQGLQKQAVDSARAAAIPQFRKQAQEELIEERLKIQEGKRVGIEVSDEDVRRMMKSISDRNKMTEEQFTQHVKGLGVDISTMRERTRAQAAWREVIRRKFAAQVSITNRDIDRMISASATGNDAIELEVQKITLAMPTNMAQSAMAKRYAEADRLRQRFNGCKTMAGLVQGDSSAKFEDMKVVKPDTIPEPTRSMLLAAKEGDVLPPTTSGGGIEIYAVCGRRATKGDEKAREQAQEELAQREFEVVAKRHLRDLRQDAHIEFR
jgi:peptidyl-prolyl cis-trans isomerase SurA